MVRDARRVMQKVAQRDAVEEGGLRHVLGKLVVERKLSRLRQQHDAESGEWLRYRCQRERRMPGQRHMTGDVGAAVVLLEADLAVLGNQHGAVERTVRMQRIEPGRQALQALVN